MIVCIAEKPSVARDIADILGARTRKEGYIEGNGYQVTWTFGHLCTLKEPHEYTPGWKSWSLGSLPMIPPRFGIKLIENPTYEKQFHIIEGLMQQADEIINCGDAGQEGELIQRWVMQKAGARCPVKRLWISSLTEEAIKEGFAKLKDQSDFQSLYEAGLSRAMGDWLLGMNATRLYTIKYGQNKQVLSIGRVQTPTLALIVNRQLEIENFKPEPYWELKTVYRETTFSATKGKFTSKEEGLEFLETVKQSDFVVTDVSAKKGVEYAPRLFDLTSLQVVPLYAENMMEELSELKAPLGIYMVPGNHEYISGMNASARFIQGTPIQLLRDSIVTLPSGIQLIGRDDRSNTARRSLQELMANVDKNKPIILLDHQPYKLTESETAGVDLQFSGHTHRGQVWPMSLVTDYIYEQSHGYRQWGNSHIYVSSGLSLWGPPFRIGTESEMVVLQLSTKE